jgi:hypothetical protein
MTPELIELIARDIRETDLSFTVIAKRHGSSLSAVLRTARKMGPSEYTPRVQWVRLSAERLIELVALAIGGATVHEIAARIGIHASTTRRYLRQHSETIEASRQPEPKPVAEPVSYFDRWLAEGFDPVAARSMDRLRAAPGILPVNEYA